MDTLCRRLIWGLLLAGACLWAFGGCASQPLRVAPRFTEPSTEPIRKAIAVIHDQHVEAKKQIAATEQDISQILDTCPQAKEIIAQAQFHIAAADQAVDAAESARAEAEGSRGQLQDELRREVAQANALANAYDQQALTIKQQDADISALMASRHSWVKHTWLAGMIAAGLLAWILRKPLGALAGVALRALGGFGI